jgi:hypothetical protein
VEVGTTVTCEQVYRMKCIKYQVEASWVMWPTF